MPKIQVYENQIGAQGGINSQASPLDFGAAVGEGLQRVGGAMGDVANQIYQQAEAQDTTNVHVQMAAAREQWTQAFQDRVNQATPGDDTFAPKLTEDMSKWFEDGASAPQTPTGRRLYQSLSSQMVSEFGQRAISAQAQLAGVAARNQTTELIRSSGDTAFNDPTQRDQLQANLAAAFNDPKSIYAKIPKPARDAMLAEAKNSVDQATVRGIVRANPDVVLNAVAPAQLDQFKPWQNLIQTYVAPGGKADISDATVQQAPTFTKAAAEKGLNPNILMAQADLKPGTDPTALAGDMAKLVDRYGGDYAKAAAAYHIGTSALDSLLKINGSTWESALPAEAKIYVDSVMQKSGSVAAPNAGQVAVPQTNALPAQPLAPVQNSAIPAFNGLTWEQQDQAINESVRLQHLRMMMAQHARAEADRVQAKQQEAAINGYITRIYSPADNGGAPAVGEIANDTTLTGEQKNRVVSIMMSYQRELKNNAETKSNPWMLNKLGADMVAADNDPTRAPSLEDSQAALARGAISLNDYMRLQGVYTSLKDANGNSFVHQMSAHVQDARRAFLAMPQFIMNPAGAEQAAAQLQGDLQDKVQEFRKEGKNPRALLNPSDPNYFFKPGTLNSYAVGTRAALADKAAAVAQDQFKPEVGKTYKVNGKMRTYLGGKVTMSTSWSE